MSELIADSKEIASLIFNEVAKQTSANFPEKKYRPIPERIGPDSFETAPHRHSANSDGTGTKPELAERLAMMNNKPQYFEGLGFDLVAMVADDDARYGRFTLGIVNSLDVNSADDEEFIHALARGIKQACDAGKFCLLNAGETAELGYRTAGIGKNHLNWNAVAEHLINEHKVIDGSKMRPGNVVVGLREKSIRSNGLTMARKILKHAYLNDLHFENERAYAIDLIQRDQREYIEASVIGEILDSVRRKGGLQVEPLISWHEHFPDITAKLLTPSTIYSPLIYEAQGGVDGPLKISLLGCAHITGRGVPEKAKRMLKGKGLGIDLNAVFPDPEGIPELLELAVKHGKPGAPLISDQKACMEWNRGVGFLCVVESDAHADDFEKLASEMGYEAKAMGTIIPQKLIRWRGHEWTYP